MTLKVTERAAFVATFRWIEVRLMETLAAWTPTTPEMEAKLLFGAHIWDAAQHADILGKRTHELRLPLQHSLKPAPAYVAFLDELASTKNSGARISGFYDCALPDLRSRFGAYLERVDQLLDGPTVRLIERILFDMDRMIADSHKVRKETPALGVVPDGWLAALQGRAALATELVAAAPEPARAA